MSDGKPTRLRLSSVLLILATAVTLLAVVGGSRLVLGLAQGTFPLKTTPASSPLSGAPLVVGLSRTPGGPSEWITYARVLARLQKDLGRPVILQYIPKRSDASQLVEREEVDIGIIPTSAYLELQASQAATMVAVPVLRDHAHDSAVMVVDATSSVERLEQLRGSTLALAEGSLDSQGFVGWLFERRGQEARDFFGAIRRDGVQDENLRLVVSGEASATAARRSDLAAWQPGTFRVVAESPTLGMAPVVARSSLDATLVTAIRTSLLSAGMRSVIPTTSIVAGFRVPAQDEYDFQRELVEFLPPPGLPESEMLRK